MHPTLSYAVDLVNDVQDLPIDGENGIWHHAHPEVLSWAEIYRETARIVGIDASRLQETRLSALGLRAPPAFLRAGQ